MGRDHCHENIQHFEQHHHENSNHINLPLNLLTIHEDHCNSNRGMSFRDQYRGEEFCRSRTEAKLFGVISIFEQERTSIRFDNCSPRRWEYDRPHMWLNERIPADGGCFPQPIFVPEIRVYAPVYGYMPAPQYIPVGPMHTFNRCPEQSQGVPPGYFDERAQSGYSTSDYPPPGYSRPVYSDMTRQNYNDQTSRSDEPQAEHATSDTEPSTDNQASQNGPTQEDLSKEVDPDPARQAIFDKNLPDIPAPRQNSNAQQLKQDSSDPVSDGAGDQ